MITVSPCTSKRVGPGRLVCHGSAFLLGRMGGCESMRGYDVHGKGERSTQEV